MLLCSEVNASEYLVVGNTFTALDSLLRTLLIVMWLIFLVVLIRAAVKLERNKLC